jgi:hypothetical protein
MQFQPLCTPEVAVKGATLAGEAHPIRCKRWSCPVCHQINRRKVIAVAAAARPRAMLTLTVSSKQYPEVAQAALALKNGLKLLRLGLKRHPRLSNFEFLAVFEKHKSGHPHLHLLIKGTFIPWQYLKRRWREITGSTQIFINFIRNTQQAAGYAAKYIGKDLSAFEGCKRWWRSHGYSKDVVDNWEPDRRYGKPTRYLANVSRLAWAMRLEGFEVERLPRQGIRWRAPPDYALGLDYLLCSAEGRTNAAFLRKSATRRATP